MFAEDGLAVATTVDTAAEDECVYTCLALSIVIAVIAIVVVYVTKSAKGDGITNETIIWDYPTKQPTPSQISDHEKKCYY